MNTNEYSENMAHMMCSFMNYIELPAISPTESCAKVEVTSETIYPG
jgi:hypothetical protein